jgi:hypothetical protein
LSSFIDELDDSDEDDSLPSNFVVKDWIGCGKEWNDDIPKSVKKARNVARHIPPEFRSKLIPAQNISVTALLSTPIGNMSPVTLSSCQYSTDAPNTFVEAGAAVESHLPFLVAALPNLPTMRKAFDLSWLSGFHSISLPGNITGRYPLWIEHLLGEFKVYTDKRVRWERTEAWLHDIESNPTGSVAPDHAFDLVEACRHRFYLVPWNCVIPNLSRAVVLTTPNLALFLSTDWLNDEMINAGTGFILHRLGTNNRTRILNCLMIPALRQARTIQQTYSLRKNSALEIMINGGLIDTLYVPLHVFNSHWTLLKIDLLQHTFSYGDSLHPNTSPPEEVADLLRWWLKTLRPQILHFDLVPSNFAMPQQADGHSCGVIVLCVLANILLGYDSWTQATASCERMEWFLRLSEVFEDNDNIVSSLLS